MHFFLLSLTVFYPYTVLMPLTLAQIASQILYWFAVGFDILQFAEQTIFVIQTSSESAWRSDSETFMRHFQVFLCKKKKKKKKKKNKYFCPQITTFKKTTTYSFRNPVPGLGQVQKVAVWNKLIGFPRTIIKKNCRYSLQLKRTTHYMLYKQCLKC